MNFPELARYPYVALDTETTGLHWWKHKVFGLVVALPDGQGTHYYDLRDEESFNWAKGELKNIKHPVFHNAKFDIHHLREAGIHVNTDNIHDTCIRAALLNEHEFSYELDHLGNKYVGQGKYAAIYEELAQMFGGPATKQKQMPNLHLAPKALVEKYAIPDGEITLKLFEHQRKLMELDELDRVYRVEQDLIPVLVDMEKGGVRVDIEATHLAARRLTVFISQKQRLLNDIAGFNVNANSGPQMQKIFKPEKVVTGPGPKEYYWKLIDGTLAPKTEGGAPSLNADTLRKMNHPAAKLALEIRQLIKTKDTFLLGHILGHHHNGYIHANFNQTKSDNDLGTGTGRLSVNDPALQQIHKRNKEIAAIVRALFLPDEGQMWNCCDWRQMDFRVFAHYVENPEITQKYRSNPLFDFHGMVAEMTGLPRSPTSTQKGNAKQINLAMIFGMGQGRLAQEMGLPFEIKMRRDKEYVVPGPEAEAVFQQYHERVTGVEALLHKTSSVAKSRGYVKTILGRRIRFPGGKFTHKAGGLIFQGSAADALKVKLVEVHRYLKDEHKDEARLMINVHDEFGSSVPPDDAIIGRRVKSIVEHFDGVDTPIKFDIPIRADMNCDKNWWEASRDDRPQAGPPQDMVNVKRSNDKYPIGPVGKENDYEK